MTLLWTPEYTNETEDSSEKHFPLKGCDFIVLCACLTDPDYLAELKRLAAQAVRYKSYDGEIFLVGTKADEQKLDTSVLKEFARKEHITYCGNTSAKDNTKVGDVFFRIAIATLHRTLNERRAGQALTSYSQYCKTPIVFKPEKRTFITELFNHTETVHCTLVGEDEPALLNTYLILSKHTLPADDEDAARRINKHMTQVKYNSKLIATVNLSCTLSEADTKIPADRAAIIVINNTLSETKILQQLLASLLRVSPIKTGKTAGCYNVSFFVITGGSSPKKSIREILSSTQCSTYNNIGDLRHHLMNARDCLLGKGMTIKPLSAGKYAEIVEEIGKKILTQQTGSNLFNQPQGKIQEPTPPQEQAFPPK